MQNKVPNFREEYIFRRFRAFAFVLLAAQQAQQAPATRRPQPVPLTHTTQRKRR